MIPRGSTSIINVFGGERTSKLPMSELTKGMHMLCKGKGESIQGPNSAVAAAPIDPRQPGIDHCEVNIADGTPHGPVMSRWG